MVILKKRFSLKENRFKFAEKASQFSEIILFKYL